MAKATVATVAAEAAKGRPVGLPHRGLAAVGLPDGGGALVGVLLKERGKLRGPRFREGPVRGAVFEDDEVLVWGKGVDRDRGL